MSALCAFPSFIPNGGFAGLAHSSVSGLGASYAIAPHMESQHSSRHGYNMNSRSQFPSYTAYATAVHHMPTSKNEKLNLDSQSGSSLWTEEPAAKRRCTDKSRISSGWTGDSSSTAIWSQQSANSCSISSNLPVCPSGCAMCHQQQQQHQLQPNFQQPFQSQVETANRRPLQERHQNRLMNEDSVSLISAVSTGAISMSTAAPPVKLSSGASSALAMSHVLPSRSSRSSSTASLTNQSRQLCIDPKKDYASPLHVDCSVEYDLPRVVRPPPGAQPLLMLAPRRQPLSSSSASSTAGSASHHANHTSHVGRSDVLYPQRSAHPPSLMPTSQTVWNSSNAAALATGLAGDWPMSRHGKLIDKPATNSGTTTTTNNKNSVPARPMLAAPAPNLMGGSVGGAMLQRNASVAAGQCGCPSCMGQSTQFRTQSAQSAVRVQSAWSHWSPPIGATAAAAVYQQRAVAAFQAPGVTYVDQQQQVNARRRKRPAETSDKSSVSGLYATSATWMNAQTAAAAAVAADAAFAAANRFVAAPWMTNPTPHLKFPC